MDATCKAAAASDKHVHFQMCASQLGHHRPDTWGLAKVASLVGVNNADLAAADIKALDAKPTGPQPLCRRLPSAPSSTAASASPSPTPHTYAAGKQRLAEAHSLTQQCNAAVPLPPPLAQRTADSVQIAIIATAITNLLIK